jgi:hypothetical protein
MAILGPARPMGGVARVLWRLISLRFWVKTVMGLAVVGLVVVPSVADLVNAVTRPATSDEGPVSDSERGRW